MYDSLLQEGSVARQAFTTLDLDTTFVTLAVPR